MGTLRPMPLISGGLILSYGCTNRCRHCIYGCSPRARGWITVEAARHYLGEMKARGADGAPIHIAGGEPFIRYDLLLQVVRAAREARVPLEYVETNAFWCRDDDTTRERLVELREAGLPGILVSVSPFHLERIPLERAERAIGIGQDVFGPLGVTIYTDPFLRILPALGRKEPVPFERFVALAGRDRVGPLIGNLYGLIATGRAVVALEGFYPHWPASRWFGSSCRSELSSPFHIHIDLHGNYVTGFCSGIAIGDAQDLGGLYDGVPLEDRPILRALVEGGVEALFEMAGEFGYREREEGYISACHLCMDIRRHIVTRGGRFAELAPEEFYRHVGEVPGGVQRREPTEEVA